jgi:hypothetical protein
MPSTDSDRSTRSIVDELFRRVETLTETVAPRDAWLRTVARAELALVLADLAEERMQSAYDAFIEALQDRSDWNTIATSLFCDAENMSSPWLASRDVTHDATEP